jgi:hypothetical protein
VKPREAQERAASLVTEALKNYDKADDEYNAGYEQRAQRLREAAALQASLATALLLVHGTLVTVPA